MVSGGLRGREIERYCGTETERRARWMKSGGWDGMNGLDRWTDGIG